MNKNHVEKKSLPIFCDKVVFTLRSNNILALENAYDSIIDLLNEKFVGIVKVEAEI